MLAEVVEERKTSTSGELKALLTCILWLFSKLLLLEIRHFLLYLPPQKCCVATTRGGEISDKVYSRKSIPTIHSFQIFLVIFCLGLGHM